VRCAGVRAADGSPRLPAGVCSEAGSATIMFDDKRDAPCDCLQQSARPSHSSMATTVE